MAGLYDVSSVSSLVHGNFTTSTNSRVHLCIDLVCVCYLGAWMFKRNVYIFISLSIRFRVSWLASLFISVNHVHGLRYIYGMQQLSFFTLFLQYVSLHVPQLPHH